MKKLEQIGREWLDTFVVAISVAMAFRAYFYEPFNIPTGSMQPTLFGNHCEPCETPGVMQKSPLKWLNWLVSGRDYKEFVAPFGGSVVIEERRDGRFRVFVRSQSGAMSDGVSLPTDALQRLDLGPDAAGKTLAPVPVRGHGQFKEIWSVGADGSPEREIRVRKGQRIFSGYDVTGDFIFVNRWKWNFRRPARGDVMVFATTGIDRLMQGTHYIKRLTALPGETVQIVTPDVYIDGKRLEEPLKPMTGRRGEPTPAPNPGANGGMTGPATMGDGEYFACGDNSDNSFDSRYWGAVPEGNLTGTGSFVFWPIINPRWGTIR